MKGDKSHRVIAQIPGEQKDVPAVTPGATLTLQKGKKMGDNVSLGCRQAYTSLGVSSHQTKHKDLAISSLLQTRHVW